MQNLPINKTKEITGGYSDGSKEINRLLIDISLTELKRAMSGI